MMSKERELLNRCAVNLRLRDICPLLLKEISELLAQPEQQIKSNRVFYQEGYAQAELDLKREHIVDVTDKVEPVAWMQDSIELYVLEEKNSLRGYVIPLYTAPPKQEPLSDEEMRAIWKEGIRGEIPFVEIGRAIEKAHGITGVDDDN